MNVVYRSHIFYRIRDEIRKAQLENDEIEKIELTKEETDSLLFFCKKQLLIKTPVENSVYLLGVNIILSKESVYVKQI